MYNKKKYVNTTIYTHVNNIKIHENVILSYFIASFDEKNLVPDA